jgi:hypothetical protein
VNTFDNFWNAIPDLGALDSEANIELRLVVPLLESLGYDRRADIAAKYPVEFQQGRAGRKPEADFVCFYGPLHDRNNSLLVVETKASNEALPNGKAQGESYAQNLRAPLLLLTNGKELEIWQQQATFESECVLQISVSQLIENKGKIEKFLNKIAVRDYCKTLKFKTIVEATADLGSYETAELTRMLSRPTAVRRTLTLKQVGADATTVESGQLLVAYPKGAIIVGSSGYGKTTLSRSVAKEAIEARWRGERALVAIEAPLPALEASGSDLFSFLLQRLQPHQPGVTDHSFRDLVRDAGVTVICDSLDRTSRNFQRRIEADISLFLRDYPMSQFFVFSRADAEPTIDIPTLELEPLSDMQMREMEQIILTDGSTQHYSIIGMAPPTLHSLFGNPLILELALGHWKRRRDFPRDVDMLFRSWLEAVLDAEPNDQMSRLHREYALSIIAQATIESPLPSAKIIQLLKEKETNEDVLNELVRSDAVRVHNSMMEVKHDGLADYLRAKALTEKSVPDQLIAISRLKVSSDSFLPVLLMSQLTDLSAQGALWERMTSGSIETYLDALRYRRDTSDDMERLGREELSRRYLTDLLNGVDEPLDGFFPALRPAIVEHLTEVRNKPLSIIGRANSNSLSYKIFARDKDSSRVVVGDPEFPGTIRGVDLSLSRYRADSARLLGMTLLSKSIEEVIDKLDIEGGTAWAGERLIGRVRFLAERYGFPFSTDDDLSKIERLLQPHADKWYREGSHLHFPIQSMLDDIIKLRAAGTKALDPWWSRLGWNDKNASAIAEGALERILDEEYRRVQIIYKEIAESSFKGFVNDMIFYPILPLRWNLKVVKGDPIERTFVIYPRWIPVKSWNDAGADVSFDGPWPDPVPSVDEVTKSLIELGRKPNVPHYGGFTTHAGYDGSTLNGLFNGATPVTNKVISWLKEEMKRTFQNLPSCDDSFSI